MRIVSELILSRLRRFVPKQPSVASRGIRVSAAADKQRFRLSSAQGPFIFITPTVFAHHEDPPRRRLVDTVLLSLQPVIKPADLETCHVEHCLRSKIDVPVATILRVCPRADNGARTVTRLGRCGFAHDGLVQQHVAVAVIAPANKVQVRHLDVLYAFMQLPRIGVWIA